MALTGNIFSAVSPSAMLQTHRKAVQTATKTAAEGLTFEKMP